MGNKKQTKNWDHSHHGLHHFELHYEEVLKERVKRTMIWFVILMIPVLTGLPFATYQYLKYRDQSFSVVRSDR